MPRLDHVVMPAVLEHLTGPEPLLREVHRVLAPNGTLILTWPSSEVDPILGFVARTSFDQRRDGKRRHQTRILVAMLREMGSRIGFKKCFIAGLNLG